MTYLLLVLLVSLPLALSGCGSEKEESNNDARPLTVQAGPDQTAHIRARSSSCPARQATLAEPP